MLQNATHIQTPTPSAPPAASAVNPTHYAMIPTSYFLTQEQLSMIPTPSTQHRHVTPDRRGPGEVPVYCDCCPHRPKKMAVLQPDAVQIISRRSGKKHIVRIPLVPYRRKGE